jgi:hypothetical protein
MDHWRVMRKRAYALMKENPSSFVFGTGYGLSQSKILCAFDWTKNGIKYISELHNVHVLIYTEVLALPYSIVFFPTRYISNAVS